MDKSIAESDDTINSTLPTKHNNPGVITSS